MALGSNEPKKPTRQQLIDEAEALDLRRQEQIRNQTNIINRILEINMLYEGFIAGIVGDVESGSPQSAEEVLKKAAEINRQYRKAQKND